MHARIKNEACKIGFPFSKGPVVEGKLYVKYTSSEDQLADILTKALPDAKFSYLKPKLIIL